VPRLSRLDFHGAIHIVHVRGRDGFNIFFDHTILALAGAERWRGVPHLLRFLQLLVKEKVLDRDAVEMALRNAPTSSDVLAGEILNQVDLELWVRLSGRGL
jgi:hypothetical protein